MKDVAAPKKKPCSAGAQSGRLDFFCYFFYQEKKKLYSSGDKHVACLIEQYWQKKHS